MTSIINGVLPVALLIAFGFALGKRGVFDEGATRALSKLVVTIALPVDLFLAAISTPRSQLGNVAYDATLVISLVGLFAVTFVVGRTVLHNDQRASTIEGLTVGFPNLAFVALPILISAVGKTTGTLPVLVGNIVTSIAVVPAAMVLLESGDASGTRSRRSSGEIVLGAIKAPLVWLPALGVALAIADVNTLPQWLDSTLAPLGNIAAGGALITVGLLMSSQRLTLDLNVTTNVLLKLIAAPILMLVLVTAFGIHGGNRTALLLIAVTPSATISGMLAAQYQAYVKEAAPTILATTVLSIIGYSVILAVT